MCVFHVCYNDTLANFITHITIPLEKAFENLKVYKKLERDTKTKTKGSRGNSSSRHHDRR